MPTISAALIVRDEEASLDTCLASLADVVDEIVVVDTGSQDDTLAVARQYTDAVHHFTWCDDFAAARNHALAQATGDWVLTIDADEVLAEPEHARARLEHFIATHPPGVLGSVAVVSEIHGPGGEAQQARDALHRFFARGHHHYEGRIHEQLVGEHDALPPAETGLVLLHAGYAATGEERAAKARRNIALLERELAAEPQNEYAWFQLGRAHFSVEAWAAAAEAFARALDRIDFEADPPQGLHGPVSRYVLTQAPVTHAYALANLNRVGEARALLEEHERLGHAGTRWADFYHALGYLYLMRRQVTSARTAYLTSIEHGAPHEDVIGTGTHASAYHLGLLAEADEDLHAALAYYREALCLQPDYPPAIARILDLVGEHGALLPADVLRAADSSRLRETLLEKLAQVLENGAMPAATLLVQQAAAIDPALAQQCKQTVQDFVARHSA